MRRNGEYATCFDREYLQEHHFIECQLSVTRYADATRESFATTTSDAPSTLNYFPACFIFLFTLSPDTCAHVAWSVRLRVTYFSVLLLLDFFLLFFES